MKHDEQNFDFRPRTRRSNGGVRGFASRLVCAGDLGSSENKSSNQTSTNNQVTIQGGASGSNTIGFGSGSSANISVESVDPAIVNSALEAASGISANALTVADNATTNAEITAGGAIQASVNDLATSLGFGAEVTGAAINASQNDLAQSLGFGAEVVSGAADVANNAIDSNTQVANAGIALGAEALTTTATLNAQDISAEQDNIQGAYDFAAGAVQQIEGDNAEVAGYYAQTVQNLGADLASASGVADPATVALATPTVDTSAPKTDWGTIIIVGASLFSVYAFLRSGGRTT